MNQSWECHKCHAVNAPHVNQCPCSAATFVPSQPFIQPYINPVYPGQTVPQTWPNWSWENVYCGDPTSTISTYGTNVHPEITVTSTFTSGQIQ